MVELLPSILSADFAHLADEDAAFQWKHNDGLVVAVAQAEGCDHVTAEMITDARTAEHA